MAVIVPPRFQTEALPEDALEVLQVEGAGAISELYRVELRLQTVEPALPLTPDQVQELLGGPCTLELGQTVLEPGAGGLEARMDYPLHGVLSELEVQSIDEEPGEVARIGYRAVLVPRLWYATRRVRTRLFQGMSVPAIIEHVLAELGLGRNLDFVLRLEEPHPEREYVLQYRESDFDFISRLAEDEGIFFFFQQAADREVVQFGDHPGALEPYALLRDIDADAFAFIRYEPRANFEAAPGLRSLSRTFRKPLQVVVAHDYDYTRPDLPIHHVSPVDPHGAGFVHHYLEGHEYTRDPSPPEPLDTQSRRTAAIRAQENRIQREEFRARSTALGLFSGYTFELENHPDDSWVFASHSPERRHRYLVTRSKFVVGQRGAAGSAQSPETMGFDAELSLVNDTVPYRPARKTKRPVVAGLLRAKVADRVGSTAADLDAYGQYSLVLDVETVGAPALNKSTLRRFRMAQPFTGTTHGMHFPLHVGCEVLLAHLGGDPDRPIILAAVPNHLQRAPVDGSNATRGGFTTRSNVVLFFNDDA